MNTQIHGLLWCVTLDTSKLWGSGTTSMCVLHTCEFADAHMLKPGHDAGLDIFLFITLCLVNMRQSLTEQDKHPLARLAGQIYLSPPDTGGVVTGSHAQLLYECYRFELRPHVCRESTLNILSHILSP